MKLIPKVVMISVLLAVVIIGGVGMVILVSVKSDKINIINDHLNSHISLMVSRLEANQIKISSMSKIIARNRRISRSLDVYESRGLSQELNDKVETYPFINYILIADLEGAVFAVSTRDGRKKRVNSEALLLETIHDNPLYTSVEGDGVSVSALGLDPFLSKIGVERVGHEVSQWFMAHVVKRGEPIGTLVISVDWKSINDELLGDIAEELSAYNRSLKSALIMDADDQVLVAKENRALKHEALEGELWSEKRYSAGHSMLKAKLIFDRTLALKSLDQLSVSIGSISFLGILCMSLLLYLFLRKVLIERISLLHQSTKLIGSGQLNYQLEDLGADEIGDLGRDFNLMVQQLSKKTTSIETLNKEAEVRKHIMNVLEDQTKELVIARESAEESVKAKAEFLASMSHEIRTPMNGVLGMLGLLMRHDLSDKQRWYAELAHSSAESLLNLINDILDFSKIEAGKIELEYIDFDLRALLGNFIESMALRAQDKHIELMLDVRALPLLMIKADPSRIRQVLTNLVGNAIKFTEQGEVVLTVGLNAEHSMLCCSVRDTGIGIPEEKVALLFESFSQVDASTTRKYGGTGLGLAISNRLCMIMQGEGIKVKSEVGKGSEFSFEIPIQPSDQQTPALSDVQIDGMHIMIVDDNAAHCTLLKAQLEAWGGTVESFLSGDDALARLQQAAEAAFDVGLIDMQMPHMDGAQLCRKIREEAAWKDRPLVAMTSISDAGDTGTLSDTGFNTSVTKPVTAQNLTELFSTFMSDRDQACGHSASLLSEHHPKSKMLNDEADESKCELRILLVDDNAINQHVALDLLEDLGHSVGIAANGLEALERLRNSPEPFDLIFMDCQMPEMDGFTATQCIRQGDAGEAYQMIPIIALTANAMKGDREKCVEAGMNDYLSKPIDFDKVSEKITRWSRC